MIRIRLVCWGGGIQQQQQQQFSPLKKQLEESMADVRPSEYLGFHSLESIILA